MSVDLLKSGNLIPVGCRVREGRVYPALVPVSVGGAPEGIICARYGRALGFGLAVTEAGAFVDRGSGFSQISEATDKNSFILEYFDGSEPELVAVRGYNALIYYQSGFTTLNLGYTLRGGVMHCGRLFGINDEDGYMIVWSGTGGLDDWKKGIYGAGCVRLAPDRGEALDILVYGGRLAVVREYGISVISAYGTPESFSVKPVDAGTDRTIARTAQTAGGKLYFFTEGGLYSFDGTRISRVEHMLSADFTALGGSCALGNRYFARGQSAALGRVVVLCYDCDDNDSFYIDVSAEALGLNGGAAAYCEGAAYSLEEGGSWTLTATGVDFSSGRKKTVTGIYARGAEGVTVSNGDVSREIEAEGKITPSLRGESFTFTARGSAVMSAFTATAEEEYGI